MRKSIKKIAATLLAATMVLGTCVSAFGSNAPTETCKKDSTYSVVGSCYAEADKQWNAESEACIMTKGDDYVYTMDLGKLEANSDYQFKIVMDGVDYAWAYQLLYGTQYFGDNCSQLHFGIDAAANVKVTFEPLKGEVKVYADDKEVAVAVSLLSDERAFNSNSTVPAATAALYAAEYLNYVKNGMGNTYSLVGADGFANAEWAPEDEKSIMVNYDANTASVYNTKDVVAGTYEFKIVKDGVANAWALQLMLGTVEYGDNYTQFKVEVPADGTATVMFSPYSGDVVIYEKVATGELNEDGTPAYETKKLDYTVKYSSRDEDTDFAEFVAPSAEKCAAACALRIEGDAKLNAFDSIDTSIAFPLASFDAPAADDDNKPAADDKKPTTTTTTAAAAATTTAANQATQTGDVAPVALMVVLFAAVAVVAVVAKKKEA